MFEGEPPQAQRFYMDRSQWRIKQRGSGQLSAAWDTASARTTRTTVCAPVWALRSLRTLAMISSGWARAWLERWPARFRKPEARKILSCPLTQAVNPGASSLLKGVGSLPSAIAIGERCRCQPHRRTGWSVSRPVRRRGTRKGAADGPGILAGSGQHHADEFPQRLLGAYHREIARAEPEAHEHVPEAFHTVQRVAAARSLPVDLELAEDPVRAFLPGSSEKYAALMGMQPSTYQKLSAPRSVYRFPAA
jgi:hypothetical protein